MGCFLKGLKHDGERSVGTSCGECSDLFFEPEECGLVAGMSAAIVYGGGWQGGADEAGATTRREIASRFRCSECLT